MTRAAPLRARLARALGPRAGALRTVVREARACGVDAWLVGGPVRDLLLEHPVLDVDVLLADRLEAVARRSARALGARVQVRPRFLTATLEVGDGLRIDLSRARSERYPTPGALPRVAPATPQEDLPRRDFSIHAMALPLDAQAGTTLLDPLGGRADLSARRIRVLHDASFVDDPTRLLRAARYGARLGFRLEPHSAALARAALRARALDHVSGTRVLAEIERLLEEADSARAARRSEALGLFAALASGWHVGDAALRGLRRLDATRSSPPWPALGVGARREAGLRLLLRDARARTRDAVLARLAVQGRPAEAILRDVARVARLGPRLRAPRTAGALDEMLHDAPDAALLYLHCALPATAARQVARYARDLRTRPDPIDGHVARAAGARGPEIGALLRAARRRALDGRSTDAAWQRAWLARHRRMG